MGLTYYDNQELFFKDFSFLTDPNANKAYLYGYNTDWQDQIYRNSNTTDFLFRVEGGDNIAKYNISLGYLGNDGTVKNTNFNRYNAPGQRFCPRKPPGRDSGRNQRRLSQRPVPGTEPFSRDFSVYLGLPPFAAVEPICE